MYKYFLSIFQYYCKIDKPSEILFQKTGEYTEKRQEGKRGTNLYMQSIRMISGAHYYI